MTPEEMKERTTAFAVEVVKFCRQLRKLPEARITADQLSDSAQSIASNYRAACRARSHREFISKISVSVEEADETVGWLAIARRADLASTAATDDLYREAGEILAASRRTAESRRKRRDRGPRDRRDE
jgi:four helix bundle protein